VEPIEGSHFTLRAELAIKALGFDPEDLPGMFNEPALEVTRWGTLKVDHRTFETSLPHVFAAGDIVRGASLVVWAIRDGRDAAEQIHLHLERQTSPSPLEGEGWGEGWRGKSDAAIPRRNPSPQPSPSRGEGVSPPHPPAPVSRPSRAPPPPGPHP
jgi:hypothetical protein